ncbi:Chromate resistance protein ChrB [Embleya sp. AB8]|uniref:Chromate resistance protein ChrB n=1 Tax=Embleya sp. AB8 TaxID=3156304 RepID=UPI003C78BCF7
MSEERNATPVSDPAPAVAGDPAWLLVAVSTAGAPDSLRVHVWRKLRGLGAVYVQQSVCLLPDRPAIASAVRRLMARVRAEGGTARSLHVRIDDPVERGELIGEFRAVAAVEYGEVLERLPAFFEGIRVETARKRATYAEVEAAEADLARFETRVAKIAARDYFPGPIADEVRAELDRAHAVLATFEAVVSTAGTEPRSEAGSETGSGVARRRAANGRG